MGETCDVCKNESRIIAVEKDVIRNSEQHKEFYAGLKGNDINQARTEVTLNQILSSLQDLRKDMSILTSKPGKNWDKVVSAIIGVVVTAGVMYIINK